MLEILALIIAIPIILLPVAFVWYLNIGGVVALMKDKVKRTVPRTA